MNTTMLENREKQDDRQFLFSLAFMAVFLELPQLQNGDIQHFRGRGIGDWEARPSDRAKLIAPHQNGDE
ncbi:MAG: hypothetical protein ACREOO_27510 [bacterium]